jgi:Holliday junction resolvase RusA-like endonuclease
VAKVRHTIEITLPAYQRDRSAWRRAILETIRDAGDAAAVTFDPEQSFEVVVLLYMTKGKRHDIHDVDNRLKDILDALQGRFKGSRSARPLIANDRKVCRVLIEKQENPKLLGDSSGGRLLIRPYRRHRWPLQPTKGHGLHKARAR